MRLAAAIMAASVAVSAASASEEDFEARALAAPADPAYGEYLASECLGCHRRSGADDGIPGIVGWPREAFVHALALYRAGARNHQVMEMVARTLGPEETASLAAYFGALAQD